MKQRYIVLLCIILMVLGIAFIDWLLSYIEYCMMVDRTTDAMEAALSAFD